ncbi:MAG: histidine phosphatase family protein [Lachnospiraceae bacterium]|nr:histidine phosphatase family protein [Lachnospiraceae bacterium]
MRLYIIRHGETNWNVQGRLQGQTDIDLNENGVRLAKVTAEGMKEIPFDLGITSPLIRARHTAEIILAGRSCPILEDGRIAELSFGSWEGLGCHKDNFEIPSDHFEDFYLKPYEFTPGEGGETIGRLCERTREFYQELIANPDYQDKTILIATHGCASRAILNNIYEDKEDFWRGHVPMNCAVNIVDVKDKASLLVEEDKIYYSKKDCVDFYAVG